MNHREPRLYSFDSQPSAWASSHAAVHNLDYMTNGYAYDTPNHYYPSASQETSNMGDSTWIVPHSASRLADGSLAVASSSGPYFRSMTPSLMSGHRYPHAGRESRYPPSQDFVPPTSPLSPTMYTQHSVHYASHCLPIMDQHPAPLNQTTQQTRFIPTPSQIAHAYSTYSPQISSSALQGDLYDSSPIEYSSAHHMVPSNTVHRRPSRTLTGRPRGGSIAGTASPTTTSSPSGERFPCENCGKTFSRSHDRKRHYETQHLPSPIIHRCMYCHKEFSRCDSSPCFVSCWTGYSPS